MNCHFNPRDNVMFSKYLDNSSNYFEYGSGGSTFQATIRDNIKRCNSVESDKDWIVTIDKNIKKYNQDIKTNLIFVDLKCDKNNWGNPGKGATLDDYKKYSNQIALLKREEREKIDMVLIDGRFRVACCLKTWYAVNESCNIVFDDFLNRSHYHVVLDYFEMVVLRKKKNVSPPSYDLIQKYESDRR